MWSSTTSSLPPPAILAEGLSKAYGPVVALDGLSLAVAPGEVYGLLGPDGAGKTTLMRLLVGALRMDAGRASLAGLDIARQTEAARERLGYLAARFSLYGDLTVAENLRFFGQVRGLGGDELSIRSVELLDFVGLAPFAARPAAQLSGGMKQKLGLACALIHRPSVLLLDEPSAGLDPLTRGDLWQLILRVLAQGAAVLVATPYMDEAARCTRLGLLRQGRLLAEGTPRQLTAALEGRVLELRAGPRAAVLAAAAADEGVEETLAFGDHFHLRVRDAEAVRARLPAALAAAGATVEGLRPVAPTMEDAFIALYAADEAGADAHA